MSNRETATDRDLHDERRRHEPDAAHEQRGYDLTPAWSPDGTKIAFATQPRRQLEIYTMNADGTGQTRLADADSNRSPDWQPVAVPGGFRGRRARARWRCR